VPTQLAEKLVSALDRGCEVGHGDSDGQRHPLYLLSRQARAGKAVGTALRGANRNGTYSGAGAWPEAQPGVPQLPSPAVAEGVVIRPECEADHPVIAEVVRAAFVGHPDEVASFVERIRTSEQFIPQLALVAEDSSGVIAHLMLSWVGVEGGSRARILNLTPVSVRPDRQRIGVGARLIQDALGRAERAGEPAVMVEGIAAYYPRFGFERASTLGFISPHPKIPDEAFMVKRLPGYSSDLAGRIVYPAAFDGLGY
jgi:putative acetyltransferase